MKKYLKIIIGLLLVIGLSSYLTYRDYVSYNKATNEAVNSLVMVVNKNYPEVTEEEILNIINTSNYEEKDNILKKYGYSLNDIAILKNSQNTFYRNLIINGSLTLLLSSLIIIIYVFKKRQEDKNLQEIITYLKKINTGDYDLELASNTEGKLSILKNEIYKTTIMLKENALKALEDKNNLKDSLSNISHQLKTPLTSILLLVDTLEDDSIPNNLHKEFLQDIKMQVENINFLIIAMLKLSRFDANVITFKKEKINVKKLVFTCLKNLEIIKELKNVDIHVRGSNDITFEGDYNWELEAITNIVKNAIEHTPENGKINILYEENNFYTKVVIVNEGSGLSLQDKKHIFDRFYQGSNASSDNFGIGLALAKEIINKDNGIIRVDTKEKEFTRFTIKYYK